MITINELLSGHNFSDILSDHQANLNELLVRMNKLRAAYNKAMNVTSGYRSKDDQIRIYTAKKIPINKIPMGSAHLSGAACDILDIDGKLMEWTKNNSELLITTGLWVEDDTSVPRVHFQIYAPKSGNRFFKP